MVSPPCLQQREDRLQPVLVFFRIVMDGDDEAGVRIPGKNGRQGRMAMQKEPVADDFNAGARPVPPHETDETRQYRVDGGLAAKQGEARDRYTSAPESHPAIGLLKRDDAGMGMIGIVRAALARQVAAVCYV